MADSTRGVDGDLDILQFSAPIYFVEKDEGSLQIDVMRLGHLRGRVRVHFRTEDGSAKAGALFEAASGEMVMEPGQSDASIVVKIFNCKVWAPTLEFKLRLSDASNCVLGKYLHTCRVKIIDKDMFPSRKYASAISRGEEGISGISGPGLLWEYFKLNWKTPRVAFKSLLTVLCGQLHNAYLFWTIYVTIYLVDKYFRLENLSNVEAHLFSLSLPFDADHKQTAIGVGVLYAVPMIFLHLWDYTEARMDVRGASRAFLQASIFRKYLNYSEDSRAQINAADMQLAILQDANDLANGYVIMLHLVRMSGKVAVMGYFVAVTNLASLWMLGTMCALMVIFGVCRNRILATASDRVNQKMAEVGSLVSDTCHKYRLVADYAQRPQINERFAGMVQNFRTVDVPAEVVKMNNNWFPKWLGPVFIGIFIALDAPKVFTDEITLGEFVTTMGIFNQLSLDFTEMYADVLELARSIVSLKSFTKYFNMRTDMLVWKKVNRQRRQMTFEARSDVLGRQTAKTLIIGDSDEVAFRSDTIALKVVDMGFSVGKLTFQGVNLSVQQGKLTAVVGPHASGKSTFLKLLAHVLFPSSGTIFIPTHLRILHVSQEPILLNMSVWQNLLFGLPKDVPVDRNRIEEILERLKMSKTLELISDDLVAATRGSMRDVQVMVDSAVPGSSWQDVLTYTEKVKIHLARAFIMNPEVLVLQRPLHHFESTLATLILDVMKRHVAEKGLAMPQGNAARHRRPRTCFFIPETVEQAKRADVIWQISSVSASSSTVHLTLPTDLADGFERPLTATPMSLLNPTVALQMNDGYRRTPEEVANSTKALSDQIANLI